MTLQAAPVVSADLLVGLAAIVTALGVIAAGAARLYRVLQTIKDRFKAREVDRIATVAASLIDQAASQLGSRVDGLAGEIRTDREQRAEDRRQGSAIVGEWEIWRAGTDARLDLHDDRLTELERERQQRKSA